MRNQIVLLFLGASVLVARAQGAERTEIVRDDAVLESEMPIKKYEAALGLESVKEPQPQAPPVISIAAMVKQVLGEVYTEVGHIPEPQWFEMEPIAEEYVKVLFETRAMDDGTAATRLSQEARAKFESAINAKLTAAQKKVWNQKRADEKVKMQHLVQLMSSVNEEARQALEDSQAVESAQVPAQMQMAENSQVLSSNPKVTKSISSKPGSKSIQFEFK